MNYVEKKRFFDQLLTIYGRNSVMEALQEQGIQPFRLHLAKTNRPAAVLDKIVQIAEHRGVDTVYHSREQLGRISRNLKQDQGVALDIKSPVYGHYSDFLNDAPPRYQLIALDRITNPQNLGMIIRSVCASPGQGLLLPEKGCAPLSPLVIKASAGSIFRCPIYRCAELAQALADFKNSGAKICTLNAESGESLAGFSPEAPVVYVLGNETSGISREISILSQHKLHIPMRNSVESLNVAVTAALLAFRDVIATTG
jgi:23S rRNA (guanosine2251-2'-O)-methyltransferase